MKLDSSVVGQLLLAAEADRAESERRLKTAIEQATARANETATLVEALRADLSHERSEAKSISELQASVSEVRKKQDETAAQLRSIAALVAQRDVPTSVIAPLSPQKAKPQTVRVFVREKDGNGDISVADVKIGYE